MISVSARDGQCIKELIAIDSSRAHVAKLFQDRLIMKMAMEQKERKMGPKKEKEDVLTTSSQGQGGPKDLIIRHL